MTASTTKILKIGTQCFLVNSDNVRHADEVVTIDRVKKTATEKLPMVMVRSFVDGTSYLTKASNMVVTSELNREELASLRLQQQDLRIKLAKAAERKAEEMIAEAHLVDIQAKEQARRDAAWASAEPVVIYRREESQYIEFGAKISIAGPKYTVRGKGREGEDLNRQDVLAVDVHGKLVNWCAVGSTTPTIARAYAKAILLAADVAEGKA